MQLPQALQRLGRLVLQAQVFVQSRHGGDRLRAAAPPSSQAATLL